MANSAKQIISRIVPETSASANVKGNKTPVVWVDTTWPFKGADAGSARTLEMLRLMIESGHRVVFVYLGPGIKAASVPGVELSFSLKRATRNVFSVNGLAPIIWFSRIQSAVLWSLAVKRIVPESRSVFDTVDLTYRRLHSIANSQASVTLAVLARKFFRLESDAALSSSKTVVVSDLEKSELSLIGLESVHVIPTIHERTALAPRRANPRGIVFIGNFAHFPNEEGLDWFLNLVWPFLSSTVREEGLVVVGKNAPKHLYQREISGVVFRGWVEDAELEISKARVSIAPLLSGAGVKGKISQSMSLGVPVVTTTIGAEGMNLVSGKTALVADDPRQFAGAIELIFEDPVLAHDLSRNAAEFAELSFGVDRARRELKKLMEEISDEQQE